MKKISIILVMGLLWCGNAYALSVKDIIKPGMTKKQVEKIIFGNPKLLAETVEMQRTGEPVAVGMCGFHLPTEVNQYFPEFKTEITTHTDLGWGALSSEDPKIRASLDEGYPWYVFENVYVPIRMSFGFCKEGDGVLKGVYFSKKEALIAADPNYLVRKKEDEKNIAEKPKEKKLTPIQSPEDNKVVPAGSGTGFFVSNKGHIISNHHVIESCKSTKVSFKGDEIEAKILAVDKVNDIAILKTNINPDRIFPVSNEDVSLLEDVIVAGYPLGKKVSSAIKTHKGVVTALAGAGDNFSEFQTDATINQGNSGGPVINQKGNVVGIAVALMDVNVGQNIFFAIKSSTLKQFANSNSLNFVQPNNRELSNKDLGKLITEATVYLECHMTIAKIKQMIAQENNRKAFFSEYQ
jgi:hypothetical protein